MLIAPITFTSYDAGIMLGLKGFAAAMLGALAGVLIAPITFTSYDAGIMLGLKGFAVIGDRY